MKKQKTTKPFYFKDKTHLQMIEQLNMDYPINLKYNEDLVERVHNRYPLIDKAQVGFIIKLIFQSIRELLVMGKILNFNKLFFDTKLFVIDKKKNGNILPTLKVKISTPPPMRKSK